MTIAPQSTTTPNLPLNLATVPIIDMRGQLPVNPKQTWKTLHPPRDIDDLNIIAIHHDAWPKKNTVNRWTDIELMREIAGDHIRSTKNLKDGDGGFPYHLWIRDGKIYICNDLDDLTYGIANNNTNTVHICVSGDYTFDVLEQKDLNALYRAILYIKPMLPNFERVEGHGEINPSSCPGFKMAPIRTELLQIEKNMKFNDELDKDGMTDVSMMYEARTRLESIYATATKSGPYQAEAIRKYIVIRRFLIDQGILIPKV